jgi:Predicted membrane protein (DUF2061)
MDFLLGSFAAGPSRRTERNFHADQSRAREGHGRSFAKAVMWRIVGTIDTFINGFLITRRHCRHTPALLQDKDPDLLFERTGVVMVPQGSR